ncbi:ORF6N domain-containing protein [Parapedobacter pyrenivorans]
MGFVGLNVMIDSDLATLKGLETKVLNQAVRRNIERFPNDFMFQLTKDEWANLRSQFVTASWGGRRNEPFVFTEHWVLMLSSVLNSQRAIQVNIRIMRIFNQLRTAIMSETDIRLEIEKIKRSLDNQDKNIELVFQYLDELNDKIKRPPLLPDREMVGYKIGENN